MLATASALGSLRGLTSLLANVSYAHPHAAWQHYAARLLSTEPLRFCIVGSGPAGFYTADRMLKRYGDQVTIDILDRLPTPFGLVRSGVAPDHPDTKNVINGFTATAERPGCAFIGNVHVGVDVSLQELRRMYHAVVLAYGAEADRSLGIPGEDAKGVFSAREFVWWYNGHPDCANLPIDLSNVESVAVCGVGNVALDCARVLLRPWQELSPTDVASHAVDQLRNSKVKEVHLVARRGPVQVACTPKELKELLGSTGVSTNIHPSQMAVTPDDQAEMKATRLKRRVYDIMSQATSKAVPDSSRRVVFQFYRSPVEVVKDGDGCVAGLKVEKNVLAFQPGRGCTAVGTGEYETLPVQMVLKSIGYKGKEMEGVGFDASRGVIPNVEGRVLKEGGAQGEVEKGVYVCGWLKRGPTGIIGTNLIDAEETVDCVYVDTEDLRKEGEAKPGRAGLLGLLQQKGVRCVAMEGWKKINDFEVAKGLEIGKTREKVVCVEDMLKVARV